MSLGIFDTIGPIMHGPSSNHTGGMVKIAAMARGIMGGCPNDFLLEMFPTFYNIYIGQRTHVAVMAGMLGYRESDLECNSSLDIAEAKGITFKVQPTPDVDNRNVIRISGDVDGQYWSIDGDSYGAGNIYITFINGVPCRLDGNTHVCVLRGEKQLVEKTIEVIKQNASDEPANAADMKSDADSGMKQTSAAILPEIYEGTAKDGSYIAIIQSQKAFGFAKASQNTHCCRHGLSHAHNHEHCCHDENHNCDHEDEHQHNCDCDHGHSHTCNLKSIRTDIFGPYVFRSDLTMHIIPPLTKFYPKGEYPLDGELRFEKFLELTKEKSLSDVLIDYECARDKVSREEVTEQCEKTFDVMMDTLDRGKNGAIHLIGGITDPDDGKYLLARAKEGKSLISDEFSELLGNALISSGMNASGERIVATPTGGSSGVLPACLGMFTKKFNSSRKECIDACFAAAAVGLVYGEHCNFTGTGAGCQSEIGVSAGMAAAAIVSLAGGSVEAMFHASAIAAKNLLGLTCDIPIGPVEVPCIKRNAIASAIAVAAAEMALAGVKSSISPDGVAVALADTAKCMPSCLRCNQEHGLASTETATEIKEYWAERLKTLK